MKLVSTRGEAPAVDFRTAVLRGLAPDGGLYQPEPGPPLPEEVLGSFRGKGFRQIALEVAHHLLGDELGRRELKRIVEEALDFPVPLRRIGGRVFVLELFHGPTLAFKDVGARFLARLLAHWEEAEGPREARYEREPGSPGAGAPEEGTRREPPTVLVATSGDTGSAVGHAFRELTSSRVVILFPRGKTSRLQQRHIAGLGGNVEAVEVQGSFDDCQRLVKTAFRDPGLKEEMRLTSANSINVGRLLPQAFYYFHAWARLQAGEADVRAGGADVGAGSGGAGAGRPGVGAGGGAAGEVVFSVPSGNFGNLTAGLLAKRLGLEPAHLVAATNANDVVPRYLETGGFAPRPSVRTLSNAMDVGDPSNFERILHLGGGDVDRVRRTFAASSHGDEATRECIVRVHQRHGYLLDPHSAVGYLALREELDRRPDAAGVLLATAHPGKFAEVVEPLVGVEVPVPHRFTETLRGAPRVVSLEPELGALRELLLAGGRAPGGRGTATIPGGS